MDLIHKRYSSPFFYLNLLIDNHKFSDGIDTIYKEVENERLWQLYLHSMSEKSFNDWKDEIMSANTNNKVVSKMDFEATRTKAKEILHNFKPV